MNQNEVLSRLAAGAKLMVSESTWANGAYLTPAGGGRYERIDPSTAGLLINSGAVTLCSNSGTTRIYQAAPAARQALRETGKPKTDWEKARETEAAATKRRIEISRRLGSKIF